jgi:hypothetical protein
VRDGDQGPPDTGVGCVLSHVGAGGHAGVLVEDEACGRRVHADHCELLRRCLRQREQAVGRDDDLLSPGPAQRWQHDAVADDDLGHVRSDGGDDAGALVAGHPRRWRRRQDAGDGQEVVLVQRRVLHVDEHVPRAGCRGRVKLDNP